MKAIVNTKYGKPEVLHLQEVPTPSPLANEVLIRIHASSINRTDCGFRQPEYLIVRLIFGLFKPGKTILGNELSGVVEKVGKDVTRFKASDPVFGLSTYKFGTHAEYLCLKETASIALKPGNLSFEEAGSICDGMMLAHNLIRKIDFSKQPRILINGASGSIGTACLQMAKAKGAFVTAVCKTDFVERVRSLGADEVIDYQKEDFTKTPHQFDVVIDAVGKSSFFKCLPILKPRGIYFSTELGYLTQNIWLALITPLFFGRKVLFPIPTDNQELITEFKDLIEAGKFSSVIDRVYPLSGMVEAARYVETGEKFGNVAVKVVG